MLEQSTSVNGTGIHDKFSLECRRIPQKLHGSTRTPLFTDDVSALLCRRVCSLRIVAGSSLTGANSACL